MAVKEWASSPAGTVEPVHKKNHFDVNGHSKYQTGNLPAEKWAVGNVP
jgi:hypothetical protein